MSGIIDPKLRILDTYITEEGRRQISSGKFKAEFFSLTDSSTFYSKTDTTASGSQDFISRFNLEASNLPQDQITFEIDDSGKLVVRELLPISGSNISVLNGQIFSGSFRGIVNQLSSSQELSNISKQLVSSTINNFANLRLLGSSPLYDDKPDDLLVYPDKCTFTITPNTLNNAKVGQLDHIESLIADKRFSHLPNYKFLPPINKKQSTLTQPTLLGNFVQINQEPILSYDQLKPIFEKLENEGYCQELSFVETSKDNTVFCQFFEAGNGTMTKLDVIDFGSFFVGDKVKHVFFVGKLFQDSTGSHTFVNMFNLVWS